MTQIQGVSAVKAPSRDEARSFIRTAERPDPREHAIKVLGLVGAAAFISVLHYWTDPTFAVWHGVYQRLYYIPIIVGAYWYGVAGGLLLAAATALAYVPHIQMTWGDNVPYWASQYAEVAMFHAAGLVTGLLADRQRRLTARYRHLAATLEEANRELQESHDQLRRAERLSGLGEIAAGLAHELRNPLAGVKGALEILTSRAQAGTPEAEFTGLGIKELARLDNLLTDFLTYARPRAPERREANLQLIVARVVSLLRPEAERARVGIVMEQAPASPLRVDPEQMEQVLFNVVLNAVQASPNGGSVRIRADHEADRAVIDVIDEGAGIPADLLPRIFGPFVTTKRHGTGLGLAVSSRIVAAHGGTITAQAAEPRGTLVRIALPLDGPVEADAAGSPGTADRPGQSGARGPDVRPRDRAG